MYNVYIVKRGGWLIIFFIFLSLIIVFLLSLTRGNKTKEMAVKNVNEPVRSAAVAGGFYPGNKEILSDQIQEYLDQAEVLKTPGELKILFVPHAGLIYSGPVAAAGFKQIQGKNYTKIILLGSSHHYHFNHAAVYLNGLWQTPLGEVKVDSVLTGKIIDDSQNILADEQKHNPDHVLEIELIFLQKALDNFQIVPILVSNPSDQLIDSLAKKIADNFDNQTLLVISTDLSHYPPYEQAKVADQQVINSILSGDLKTFEEKFKEVENSNYPNLETPACGKQAIRIALKVSALLGVDHYQQIAYQNSGDLPQGDKSRVVGYAAIGGWDKTTEEATGKPLNQTAQVEALQIARQTLESYLKKEEVPLPQTASPQLQTKAGAFVTLNKNKNLRGCIGSFEENKPLYQVIPQMAIAAASNDHRFPPVTLKELGDIKIEISVLTPKKKIDDWQKVKLGVDGVVIEKGGQSGTFLPQVAIETNWDLEEFLSQLCAQKAGLPGNCYQDPETNIYTFQAQVFEEK